MKRRAVDIEISDHAVLRFLERVHGLDVDAVRSVIAGNVQYGAELGAIIVVIDNVKYALRQQYLTAEKTKPHVVCTTVLNAKMAHAKMSVAVHNRFRKASK
jgi:hypothetical protein